MSFESFSQNTFKHRDWEKAIRGLKNYLDSIEYHYIYKYLTTICNYHSNVSVFSMLNSKTFHLIDAAMDGCRWSLAKTLTTHCPCPLSYLSETERDAAYLLCEAGIVSEDSGSLVPGDLQLLSVWGKYLMIDAAIHFSKGRIHEIYIGNDTMMMMYYMGRPPRRSEALDICSGTGILGLYMTDFAKVTVTDISPAALSLIFANAVLNGAEDKISVLAEDMRATLDARETFDVVTCNPPFVAFPSGLSGPLYAEGTGRDGLDYLRLLLEKTPRKLNDGGMGFFIAALPGDDSSPHLLSELKEYAGSTAIDVYVDGSVLVSDYIETLSPFLARMYPDRAEDSIREEFGRFVRDILDARRFYLTTLRMRKNGGSGVRLFNRFGSLGKTKKEKNERKITRYDQLFGEGNYLER